MLEYGFGFYVILMMITLALLLVSCIIPFYGFYRKRWKGLLIGMLVQPLYCAAVVALVIGGLYFYQHYDFRHRRADAMVSLRKTDAKGVTQYWHLRPNEECFYEVYKNRRDSAYLWWDNVALYDVIAIDSSAVCVDDHIVVRFDKKGRKATAAAYDEPLEVTAVDWDRVNDYFRKTEIANISDRQTSPK